MMGWVAKWRCCRYLYLCPSPVVSAWLTCIRATLILTCQGVGQQFVGGGHKACDIGGVKTLTRRGGTAFAVEQYAGTAIELRRKQQGDNASGVSVRRLQEQADGALE